MPLRVTSEGPVRIGRATIEAAWKRRQPGQRLVIRDATCRGLALIVGSTGMTWRLDWRPRGTNPETGQRWPMQALTIGTPASHSPDAARDEANRRKGDAKAGVDLGAKRRAEILEASRQRAGTVERLMALYAQALPKQPKLRGTGVISPASAKQELAHVRLALAAMDVADRSVDAVTAADVRRLLAARAAQPATARKHYGALSRFFGWAVDHHHALTNPCLAVPQARRPRAVPSRPTCPSLADLVAIWRAADCLAPVERDLVRWLVAVPCRLREGTRLDWRHLDLAGGRWALPGHLTKTGQPHEYHLHGVALALLRARHEAAGKPTAGLVFPATRSGKGIEGFSNMKRRVSAAAGCGTAWSFHDFRRSFASTCADLGVAESVADAVLSHRQASTRAGVLGVYQRSTRRPEQTAAMEAWGAALIGARVPAK